ncbi:hypothetical protein [Streptomyces bacillaris]|uniref:hypothetical protein n=1 Tax=Streptomyces bacillaris TaxID=68179 RepID=UPI0037FC3080
MDHDLEELKRVGGILDEASVLLRREKERLEERRSGRSHDSSAGSPQQALIGIGGMVDGLRKRMDGLAQYVGFMTLGLENQAARERALLRHAPLSVPSGVDRMARPLGEDTVRAMRLLRELDTFFGDGFADRIDRALAAPEATYPPADWDAYTKELWREANGGADVTP